MTREEAIRTIEKSFPADSPYEEIAKTGKVMLNCIKKDEVEDWRLESTEVLLEYALLCTIKESLYSLAHDIYY